ncbi:ribonuclease H-like domain-containing protein [Tanacetum coccineum]
MNHQTSTVPQVIPQVAYQSPQAPTQLMTKSPFVDSGFVVPVFSPGDDPIACLNKAMVFLTVVASSRFPTTNNQLRTSSNPRNHATIQDGRVTVQQVQGRQGQNYFGNTYKSNATSSRGNTTSGQTRVVKCYNYQEAGQIFDEEQLAFLADPRIPADQAQTINPHNAAFQTEDLDTYDSDCDDLSTTQAVLMANIFNYGSDVISKKAQQIKPTLYDGVVMSNAHVAMPVIDDEETLILEEESRSKMSKKAKDPERFSPQQELSAEQAFWFHILNPTIEPPYTPPVIVDIPSELPKVSLVNASLKKLKFHLTQFDLVMKKRTTSNALKEVDDEASYHKDASDSEIHVVEKERKARTILLMAIPKEHLRRFHGMDDAIEIWEAIKTSSEGLEKGYDRFNKLLSQLEAIVLKYQTGDAIHKFLRSMPILVKLAMPMKNKPDIAMIDIRMRSLGKVLVDGRRVRISMETTDDNSTEHSTCQSNDSEGSCGNTSKHSSESESESISVPNEMSTSKSVITNEKVVSESKEVEPSCAKHVKTPRQQMKNQGTSEVKGKNWNKMMERELGEGYSFIKKKCFVCGSLSHLIKDCDYYEKKMAREAEFKKQRVFNTGNRVAKPVWTNANRVNHANQFVPRSVQLNAGRPNINSVRPNINTGRTNVNSVRPRVNTGSSNVNTVRSRQPVPTRTSNSFSPKRPQVNQFNQRRHFSKSHSPVRRPIDRNTAKMSYFNAVKGNWGTAVKTSAGYNWRNSRPNSNYDSGPTFIRTDHPLKNMGDRGIFDSGCSGHMTGNKDHLDDFEEFKGGSVTFGGSKGYITGKGRIKVGNLEFDSVSFVKELGHFNLFSISQICDKQHKVLFTETECLVVTSDFKMPDENQILLKVPRQHNMYSFDMKTPGPAKSFACLIAKATSDESKLWHRRYFGSNNSAGTSTNSNDNASEEKIRMRSLLFAFPAVKNTIEKVETRKSSTNLKKEEILIEPQQRKDASSTGIQNDILRILLLLIRELDPDDTPMPELEIFHKSETGIFDEASYDEEGVVTDFNSLPTVIEVSPTPTLRIHNIHPKSQILGDPKSAVQTRSKEEPKKIFELYKMTVGFKPCKRSCYSLSCNRDERGVVVRNKARLEVRVGYTWIEGIDYWIKFLLLWERMEAIRWSKLCWTVQAPRAWYATLSNISIEEKHGYKRFQMSSMGELTFFLGLQVKQNKEGIFISQDKYVAKILKKFDLVSVKTAITPMETKVALSIDKEAIDVDVYLYRSMIENTPFNLEAFSDSDYGDFLVNLTGDPQSDGLLFLWQFLGHSLISGKCKKQTLLANDTSDD